MPNKTHIPRIALVTVNFNGLNDTLECLESLHSQLDDNTLAVVVDNASSDNELDAIIAAFPSILPVRNPRNEGWAGGNNRGIEVAIREGAQWVLLLNNDTIVSDSIFARLRAAIASTPHSILGVVINEFHDRDQIQTQGVRFNSAYSSEFFQSIATPIKTTDPPTVSEVDIVNGCSVLISKKVFDAIGLIDERFFLICEESDFCLRAQAKGFTLGVLHETHVWHKQSVSFAKTGKPLQRYYGTRNLWLLLAKHWGGTGRRGFWSSYFSYFRHTYHIFCHEREMRNMASAMAVMVGLRDAMLGRFGCRPIRSSLLSWILAAAATLLWRLRGGRVQNNTQSGKQDRP